MQTVALKIRNIQILNEIQKTLFEYEILTSEQQDILSDFLIQLPLAEVLLSEKVPLHESFEIKVWDTDIGIELEKWEALFNNLPGWDFCPITCIVDNDDINYLRKNILIFSVFSPTYAYNVEHRGDGFEIQLKGDGTAVFLLRTIEDAEEYPELYNFKGSWKEAYYLLIKTLQKGWPMEEFPNELQKFLPKQ